MIVNPDPQGWPLECNASWRRVRRARLIVLACQVPAVLVAAALGFRFGISAVGVIVYAGLVLAARYLGALAARSIDGQYPLFPAVDPLPEPEPPPPAKPSLLMAIAGVVLGALGWTGVAGIVWLALTPLRGSPVALGVWALFVAVVAWSLVRVFLANVRPAE